MPECWSQKGKAGKGRSKDQMFSVLLGDGGWGGVGGVGGGGAGKILAVHTSLHSQETAAFNTFMDMCVSGVKPYISVQST